MATMRHHSTPAHKGLDFAGDYQFPYLHLINHMGEGIDSSTHGENILHLAIEFNLYVP